MMAASVLAMACLAASPQTVVADRARAEGLARDGRTAEAMQIFEGIVAADPADVEARLWIGRLDLRLGRAAEAEAVFRAVLADHPADVDARIGLGNALLRRNAWQDALTVLHSAERDAGENADLFATLARAHRRAGDDRLALDYFRRALARSPADPDVVAGYEDVARAYGHGIVIEGFGQRVAPGSDSGAGTFSARLRVAPRLHLQAQARTQAGAGYSDTLAGGGVEWRAGRATIVSMHASGGSGNVALANTDVFADAIHYVGSFEVGASVRKLSFAGADVAAVSPVLAWDTGGLWRLEGRYSFSYSRFTATGLTHGDHSVVSRATWRGWRRVALVGSYAYGIESFEDLTADRLGAIGAHTAAGGARIRLRSLTVIDSTWEHQWRSNDSTLNRVTVSLAQFFP